MTAALSAPAQPFTAQITVAEVIADYLRIALCPVPEPLTSSPRCIFLPYPKV